MMIGCIIISSHKEWPGHGCMTVRGDAANELRVQREDMRWTGRDMNMAMDDIVPRAEFMTESVTGAVDEQ